MRLDQAIDIKYNGLSAKQVYYNNKLIWPQISIVSGLFWDFVASPSGKTLTAFNVSFDGGDVTANWGDGSSQILTSGVSYNKTFS
jgi:hypothetical protein